MEGTLVVKEERGVVNKFQNWYKEKMIDTNKAQEFESKFTKTVDFVSKAEEVKDKIGTVVIGFIPEVKFLAPLIPALTKIKTKMFELEKNLVIKAKRGIEAKFIGVDGTNQDVVIPEMNVNEIVKDVEVSAETIKNFASEVEKVGKSL